MLIELQEPLQESDDIAVDAVDAYRQAHTAQTPDVCDQRLLLVQKLRDLRQLEQVELRLRRWVHREQLRSVPQPRLRAVGLFTCTSIESRQEVLLEHQRYQPVVERLDIQMRVRELLEHAEDAAEDALRPFVRQRTELLHIHVVAAQVQPHQHAILHRRVETFARPLEMRATRWRVLMLQLVKDCKEESPRPLAREVQPLVTQRVRVTEPVTEVAIAGEELQEQRLLQPTTRSTVVLYQHQLKRLPPDVLKEETQLVCSETVRLYLQERESLLDSLPLAL